MTFQTEMKIIILIKEVEVGWGQRGSWMAFDLGALGNFAPAGFTSSRWIYSFVTM